MLKKIWAVCASVGLLISGTSSVAARDADIEVLMVSAGSGCSVEAFDGILTCGSTSSLEVVRTYGSSALAAYHLAANPIPIGDKATALLYAFGDDGADINIADSWGYKVAGIPIPIGEKTNAVFLAQNGFASTEKPIEWGIAYKANGPIPIGGMVETY